MDIKAKICAFLNKYKHSRVFLYALIYVPCFMWLEGNVTNKYYVIHSSVDDLIPFVEYFIIPYFLWFAFMAVWGLYFFFTSAEDFLKLAKLTIAGMTIFLLISAVIPNGLMLRPEMFERDNVLVDMVKFLYRVDTPTNVFPSLHVFNSLAICIAIHESDKLKKHKMVKYVSYIIAVLIILATMFLKQHSVYDVVMAFIMACVIYQFVYVPVESRAFRFAKNRKVLLGSK
ncbi:MAG: phosphatase PAP2 family protein [Schaedlerella sp.]|nr:phosphatase PAP2 family protein [Schaedlerella sp.]